MTPRTWSAAGYPVGYVAGYQVPFSARNVAPKALPPSRSGSDSSGNEESARIVARRRRVPPTGVKTGVAGEGGATPVNRGRSPLPCDPPSAACTARS